MAAVSCDVPASGSGVEAIEEWLSTVVGDAVEARARRRVRRRALVVAVWRAVAPLLLTLAGFVSLVVAAFTVSVTVGFVALGAGFLVLDVLRHLGDERGPG
jgi:hypothetical protein